MSVAELAQAVALAGAGRLTQHSGHRQEDRRAAAARAEGQARRGHRGRRRSGRASDVVNALLALGYSEKEAHAAIKGLAPGVPVAEGIRAALKALAKS